MENNHNMYTPAFGWKDNTIYDGDVPIARLLYDPEGKRAIHLTAVRLTPGGAPLVSWTLSWHFGSICTISKLDALDVHNEGSDRLRIAFTATTLDRAFASETQIELSFDSERQCYRYDATSSLRANTFPFYAWKDIDSRPYLERMAFFPREFANFLPLESYNYHAPVDPTPKKWQAFVYQTTGGGWNRVPQHHLNTPDKYNLRFPPGRCKMGFVDDPGGNPCIELIERIPSASQGGICWCMNDVHLHVNEFALNDRHRVRYALYLFTQDETAEILKKAKGYAYTEEEKDTHDRPRFTLDGTCDFETGFDFDKPDDCFSYWLPMGEIRYTAWVHDEGHGGGRCLKQETPEPARVLWQAEHSNALVVPAGRRYRITAWIKTRDLQGAASLEAWDNKRPDCPVCSEPVRGTADWHEVFVEVEVPCTQTPLPGRVSIRLNHDGQGVSWFDDVTVLDIGQAGG